MARQIRKKSGTGIYHIMLRGIPLMIQSLEKVSRLVLYKSCNDENNQKRSAMPLCKAKNRPHDPRHLCRKNEN